MQNHFDTLLGKTTPTMKKRLAPTSTLTPQAKRLAITPMSSSTPAAKRRLNSRILDLLHDESATQEKLDEILRGRNLRATLVNTGPNVIHFENVFSPHTLSLLDDASQNDFHKLSILSPQEMATGKKLSARKQLKLGDRTSRTAFFHPTDFTDLYTHVQNDVGNALGTVGSQVGRYLEPLQMVKYKKGQQFKLHHDSGTYKEDSDEVDLVNTDEMPLRGYTLFAYLNDIEEGAGGATYFPRINKRFQPKKGSAALWANVDKEGKRGDARTVHSAEPILSDDVEKVGMNVWITHSK